MTSLRIFLPILFATFALSGIAKADQPLTPTQMKEALIGNTGVGTTSRGTPYWVYYRENGEQAIETDSGFSDEGTWRISDKGQWCSKWEKIRDGEELCLTIFPDGKDRIKYTKPDGSESGFKIVKGNPENL